MARFVFKLPDIGEGTAEAEIAAWRVKLGDEVAEDAPLVDMMTDKATVELTAPVAGRVIELAGEAGAMVPVGAALVVLETSVVDAAAASPEPQGDGPAIVEAEAAAPSPEAKMGRQGAPSPFHAQAGADPSLSAGGRGEVMANQGPLPPGERDGEPKASQGEGIAPLAAPAVRARAKVLGIDLAAVQPGPHGRIRHGDLDAFMAYTQSPRPLAEEGMRGEAERGEGSDRPATEQIKLIGLRRKIAEKMALSKRTIPHFTYVEEIDATELEALRARLNITHKDRGKLTPLPFLIRALTRAAADYPMVNARFDEAAGIVERHRAIHLGVATQTPGGLMVPVVRDAHARSLWDLAAEIARLSAAARAGKAASKELSGSTITLTSLGALGGIVTTPVINHPEVAIVGVGKLVARPMVVGGAIAIRQMLNLSVSADHRVVDGYDAAMFTQAMKSLLETPALLFLDE